MIKNKFLMILLVLVITMVACKPKIEMVKGNWFGNPNGDSELALTMRDMYESMAVMKYRIETEKQITKVPNFDRLLTDTPTDEDMKNETFEGFAKAWLAHLNQMKTANMTNQVSKYKNLINTCIACHENSCPGPIVKIEKLNLNQ